MDVEQPPLELTLRARPFPLGLALPIAGHQVARLCAAPNTWESSLPWLQKIRFSYLL